MSLNRDSYDCDFKFVSTENIPTPTCHLNGLVDQMTYHSEIVADQSSNLWSCHFDDQFMFLKKHKLKCSVLVPGLAPVNSTSISNEADESSTMVWIIIGSCVGVFLVLLFVILVVCYCRKTKQSSKKPSKAEISYPNSLVEGHGVNLSRANTLRSIQHTIERLKRHNQEYVSSSDDGDDVSIDAETAVFIPRISSDQSEQDAVDVLRRAHDQYRSKFQESIIL